MHGGGHPPYRGKGTSTLQRKRDIHPMGKKDTHPGTFESPGEAETSSANTLSEPQPQGVSLFGRRVGVPLWSQGGCPSLVAGWVSLFGRRVGVPFWSQGGCPFWSQGGCPLLVAGWVSPFGRRVGVPFWSQGGCPLLVAGWCPLLAAGWMSPFGRFLVAGWMSLFGRRVDVPFWSHRVDVPFWSQGGCPFWVFKQYARDTHPSRSRPPGLRRRCPPPNLRFVWAN